MAAQDLEGKPPKDDESRQLESTINTKGAGFLTDGQPLAVEMLGGADNITQCIHDHLDPRKTEE